MKQLRSSSRTSAIALVLAVVCVASLVSLAAASVGWSAGATNDVLVVDGDGDAQYDSIQAAVDDADDGDTVEVRPGVYSETVVLDANVTLVAPRGATLDGSALGEDASAITIPKNSTVEPVVDGFTIVDFPGYGISAYKSTGNFHIENVTVENTSNGLSLGKSTGDFRIENVIVENTTSALSLSKTTGDWMVKNTIVRNSRMYGIKVTKSTGNWTIRKSIVRDSHIHGITAFRTSGAWTIKNTTIQNTSVTSAAVVQGSTGDWTIRNSTFRDNTVGVDAYNTSGDWRIRGTTFVNTLPSDQHSPTNPNLREGTAINAPETNGSWSVSGSVLVNNTRPIVATDAERRGDATGNWWGNPNGPDGDDCTGNVECGDPLTEPPAGAPTGASNMRDVSATANGTHFIPEELTFHSAPGRAIRGESTLPAGTELVVQVSAPNNFYNSIQTTTVDENGEFRTTFNLSHASAGSNIKVAVRHNGIRLATTTGNVIPCGNECPFPTPREPNATLQYQGESLTLEAGPGRVVRGQSNLPPGTELSVRVHSKDSKSFLMTPTSTVDERGVFRTTFDLSDVSVGTEFRVVVHHDGARLTNATGAVTECENNCEPPSNGDQSNEAVAGYQPKTSGPAADSRSLPLSGIGALSVGGLLAVVGIALLTGIVKL